MKILCEDFAPMFLRVSTIALLRRHAVNCWTRVSCDEGGWTGESRICGVDGAVGAEPRRLLHAGMGVVVDLPKVY